MHNEKYIICDIDGCLALNDHRSYLIPSGQLRLNNDAWRDFVAACPGDSVNPVIADLIRGLYNSGYDIILATGRQHWSRDLTINWLRENNIPFTALVCRNDDDHRSNAIVKLDMLRGCMQLKNTPPVMAIEDDAETAAMYKGNNVNVLSVVTKSCCLAI